MAVLSAVASVVSGVVSAVGAIQSANANAAAAEYNAQIAERNRTINEQNRRLAVKSSQMEMADRRRETIRTMASARAAYGASGFELAGSPLDVIEDIALEGEIDAQRIEYEGRLRSREGAIQSASFTEESRLNKMNARSSRAAGWLGAAGALAGGFANAGQSLSRGMV